MTLADTLQTIALLFTLGVFFKTQRDSRKTVSATSFNLLEEQYNQTVTFRLQNPEIMTTAADWRRRDLDKLGKDMAISQYYSYGELCVSFCTTALYHREAGMLNRATHENYFDGLMDLVASENRSFFADIIENPYCARSFSAWFRDWQHDHPAADSSPSPSVMTK